jgi:hypothetical protein
MKYEEARRSCEYQISKIVAEIVAIETMLVMRAAVHESLIMAK